MWNMKIVRQAAKELADGQRLHFLNICMRDQVEAAHERTQARLAVHVACAAFAERGEIAVVWSGRDCDGVQYSGNVRTVPADWRSVVAHIEDTLEWADGPCSYTFMHPERAKEIEYRSRDLTLEAFENGHAHSIHG